MKPYILGVAVFVRNTARRSFLIGKRKGSLDAGCWGLPGGHLEPGETIEECAKRELLEETGLEIHDVRHVAFTDDIYENKRYLTLFVVAKVSNTAAEPKIMEPDKCDGWRWQDVYSALPTPKSTPLRNIKKQVDDFWFYE